MVIQMLRLMALLRCRRTLHLARAFVARGRHTGDGFDLVFLHVESDISLLHRGSAAQQRTLKYSFVASSHSFVSVCGGGLAR